MQAAVPPARFWISLTEGIELVIKALAEAKGGETFISKIPSFKVTDLAEAMLPGWAAVPPAQALLIPPCRRSLLRKDIHSCMSLFPFLRISTRRLIT